MGKGVLVRKPQGHEISLKVHTKGLLLFILFIYMPFNFLFFFFFFFFCLFRAAPTAYGGSQARGPVGAVATSLHHSHSHTGSEQRLQPTLQLTATLDP